MKKHMKSVKEVVRVYETADMHVVDLLCESVFLSASNITIKPTTGVYVDVWAPVTSSDGKAFFDADFK